MNNCKDKASTNLNNYECTLSFDPTLNKIKQKTNIPSFSQNQFEFFISDENDDYTDDPVAKLRDVRFHLNIQSLAPKIDLIQAEYSEFDILVFTETWLNINHEDESIKLLNYQNPFRRDRGPHEAGGGSNIDDSNAKLPNELSNVNEIISNIEPTDTEVGDILNIINPSNLSLSKGIFPEQWKRANVRPISLLSVLSKCMERCVYKHVYNHLKINNILTKNQSGFTRGDSAVNQLMNISNDFGKALDSGKEIRVVFCDISKAF
ncbi:unnamed protein product [Mytilus coruscus]|uniref:Uncharacterized protein n=1 Tax=Mytilus coruscus TaxID=42192 RepID=A0A6J8DG92_MYTCO|nr:unnamed protein product [Mytilus coruscus]